MAHHSLRRAVGNWVGTLTPQDLEYLDAMQYASVDGDSGGTWNPTAWIYLGGFYGLRVADTATLQCDGVSLLNGNVTLGTTSTNTLTVNGVSTFHANVTVRSSNLNVDGDIVNAGNTDFGYAGSTHRFRGVSTFDHDATFNGPVTFADLATFTGNAVIGDSSSDTLTVRASSVLYHSTILGDSSIGYGGTPGTGTGIGDDTLTLNSVVDAQSEIRSNGVLKVIGGATLTSVVTPGTGGYVVKRKIVTGVASTLSLQNIDSALISSPGAVFVADYGAAGAVLHVINASSGTLAIQTPDTHLLITLAAHTWVDLMRDSYGSHGWSCYGQGTYTELS